MGKGITPPEEWREADLSYGYGYRRGGDPYAGHGGTEFGWGAGLVPPNANGNPPGPGDDAGLAEAHVRGGQYMPRAPRVVPPAAGFGQPIQRRRPHDEVRGYPGDIVAR
jgi:hypothetical protein